MSRLAEVLEWRTRRERSERSVRNSTRPFSFTCDPFHPSLLRRGATEPRAMHGVHIIRQIESPRPHGGSHSGAAEMTAYTHPVSWTSPIDRRHRIVAWIRPTKPSKSVSVFFNCGLC